MHTVFDTDGQTIEMLRVWSKNETRVTPSRFCQTKCRNLMTFVSINGFQLVTELRRNVLKQVSWDWRIHRVRVEDLELGMGTVFWWVKLCLKIRSTCRSNLFTTSRWTWLNFKCLRILSLLLVLLFLISWIFFPNLFVKFLNFWINYFSGFPCKWNTASLWVVAV